MKRLIAVVLCLVLLTGCTGNSYLSVRPHSNQRTEMTDTITVENYTQLRNALVQQVDQHETQISMMTYAYAGDVEQDLQEAVDYIRYSYPIGAYAIRTLSYDLSKVASYYQISFRITYSHNAWELRQLQQVRMDDLESAIGEAMARTTSQQTVMITGYRETDFAAYCQDYANRNPDKITQIPAVSIRIWPDSGSVRIVELNFDYEMLTGELQQMQEQVEQILQEAAVYAGYGRGVSEKINLLHAFLTERSVYTQGVTDTPAYSMLYEGIANSSVYAEIFRAVCERASVECYAVDGLKNGQLYTWNMIRLGGNYYHIDPYAAQQQGLTQLELMTDEQMVNYVWDQTLYPVSTP